MTPTLLREVGEALAGRWQVRPLAALLEVVPRTIERWQAGAQPIPPEVRGKLLRAIDDRIATLRQLRKLLR